MGGFGAFSWHGHSWFCCSDRTRLQPGWLRMLLFWEAVLGLGVLSSVGSACTRATSLPCHTPLWGSAVPLSLDQLMMTGCCYHTFQSWLKIHLLLAIKMRRRGTECRTPRHPITHPGTDDESWSNALSRSTALIAGELPGLLPQQCLPSAVGLLM